MKLAHILMLLLLVPVAAAQCELFSDSRTYGYVNDNAITDRVTFTLLNKTSADMMVVFEPRTLIVLPGETANFTVNATAPEDLGYAYAGFSVERGGETVARGTAVFDRFECIEGEVESEPVVTIDWPRVIGYVMLGLIILLIIFFVAVSLLPGRDSSDSPHREPRTPEPRKPVNVDAMLRKEKEEDEAPWWLWILIALATLVVIGVFVILALQGFDPTTVSVNLTNATNVTNSS